MSDYYDLIEIKKNKLKKSKLFFPFDFFKDVMRNVFQMFLPQNIIADVKNGPLTLYNRIFGSNNRRQIFDVLVLVADLEANVGAACIELLNHETPERYKNFNNRQNFQFFDDIPFLDDFLDGTFDIHTDNIFNFPPICSNDESLILDANLNSEDQLDTHINPDYLLQVSLSSDVSTDLINNLSSIQNYENNDNDSNDSNTTYDIKQIDWVSHDTSSFAEISMSENSCEWINKENINSDCEFEEESSVDLPYDSRHSIPKSVKREILQLRMVGVPYDYNIVTQTSHEEFKQLRSNPKLTKSQISSMINARRRYINRRAASRCRTQKVQQRDHLKIELDKLQEQLIKAKVTLTKAYQERNQLKDTYRELQQNFMSRLQSPNGTTFSLSKWSLEVTEDQSLLLREKGRRYF